MALNLSQFVLIVALFPENVNVQERSGTSKAGKPYTIRTQSGWFKRPKERFPEKFVFPVPEGQPAYGEGPYLVDPNSFSQGDFDAMELDRYAFRLVAVEPEFYEQLGIHQLYASFGLTPPGVTPARAAAGSK